MGQRKEQKKQYQDQAKIYFDKRLAQEIKAPAKSAVFDYYAFVGPGNVHAEYYAPPKRSMFHQLYKRSKLRLRHLIALDRFISDAIRARGNSKGLTAKLEEKVDISPGVRDNTDLHCLINDEYLRLNDLWGAMHKHERVLFKKTILAEINSDTEKGGRELVRAGGPKVAEIGSEYSGYKNKDSSFAAGVSRLHTILDTIAEFYLIK